MNKRFGAFSSSVNPDELAVTIKGMFATVGVFIALPVTGSLLSWLGVSIEPTNIVELWNVIGTSLITLITTTATFYGIIRKIFIAGYDKYKNRGL